MWLSTRGWGPNQPFLTIMNMLQPLYPSLINHGLSHIIPSNSENNPNQQAQQIHLGSILDPKKSTKFSCQASGVGSPPRALSVRPPVHPWRLPPSAGGQPVAPRKNISGWEGWE